MSVEKFLEHLPLFDGSGRRRFVAGGIILCGVATQTPEIFAGFTGGESLSAKDILSSPVIAGGAVLIVYALGSLAELIGDLSLARAASGVIWAFEKPRRLFSIDVFPPDNWVYRVLVWYVRLTLYLFVALPRAVVAALAGMVGYSKYALRIQPRLSPEAESFFKKDLPVKVQKGLRKPVGNGTDFAYKYLGDKLPDEQTKKWGRRLLIRARDVASTVTALQVVMLYVFIANIDFSVFDRKSAEDALIDRSSGYQDMISISEELQRNLEPNPFKFRPSSQAGEFVGQGRAPDFVGASSVFRHLGLYEILRRARAGEEINSELRMKFDRKLQEITPKEGIPEIGATSGAAGTATSGAAKSGAAKSGTATSGSATSGTEAFASATLASATSSPPPIKMENIRNLRVVVDIGLALKNIINSYSMVERKKEIEEEDRINNVRIINIILIVCTFVVFLFYFGYFKLLENSIVAILEAAAQR